MKNYIKSAIAIIIGVTLVFLIFNSIVINEKKESNMILLPSLPKPIAKEYTLITSAGQSSDTYIINDITNKMMIHNYFMPQAEIEDLEGVKSIVFVAGYSPLGLKLHNISYTAEKDRVKSLLERAKLKKLTIITVFVGGKQRRDRYTDELLTLLCRDTDYLIATKDADYDGFLSELARNHRMPVTIANGVENLAEPYSSAFR